MKIDPRTLSKAVNFSLGHFEHARKVRGRMMAQFVGRLYQRNAGRLALDDAKASPINLLHSAVTTLIPNLVYNEPRVRVRTNVLAYRGYGDTLALATNDLIKKIGLRETLRAAIFDAVFMDGFIKTGIASGDKYISLDGVEVALGQPYAERVDPDDMILDPMARTWAQLAYVGNKYRKALSDLEVEGADMDLMQKFVQEGEKRTAAALGGAESEQGRYAEIEQYVELVEIYIPSQGRVVTMPYQKGVTVDEFVDDHPYVGPDTGPYHKLGFTPVSDNLLSVAPAAIWYDLHILGNRIARKLARQAEREKRVLAYDRSAEEDAKRIADAEDGEAIGVDDTNKIKEVTYGGAGDDSYTWMEWVKKHFSEQAGNIDMLSGTGTNTPTATQAEMLQANTSVRLSDMQNMVYDFTAKVTRDLGFFLHTDPLIDQPLIRRVNGIETQVFYTPEMRQGMFFDFAFDIQPFSMARPDPNMAVRRKLEFATNVIPATAQASQMLGPGFDAGAFLKQMAQEIDLDGADEWLKSEQIQEYVQQRMQQAAMMGDPGKAQASLPPPTLPMPGQIGQPVPQAYGPKGGITPNTETAMAQQETAGEIQGMKQPSAKALALTRG